MGQHAEAAETVITRKLSEDFGRAAGHPELGAAQARFGRTTATRLAAQPSHAAYNKARGFSAPDGGRLAEICGFFDRAAVPPVIEVWAGDASAGLGQRLARAGFYAAEVNATLAAVAGGRPPAGGQGYLAGAATVPGLRGRGCQSALIRRRLRDAASVAGQVIVTTAFGSPSQANLERLGFAIVHTRARWRRLD